MQQQQSQAGSSNQKEMPTIPTAPGKGGRLARSRAACLECHKVKQRCDGPSVCPCHRCQTWGFECVFPSSVGPMASKSTLSRGNSSSSLLKEKSSSCKVSPRPSTAGPTLDVADQLKTMNDRLKSLESTLNRAQINFPSAPAYSGATYVSDSDHSKPERTNLVLYEEQQHGGSNPVETAGEAMAVEGLVDLSGPGRNSEVWESLIKPDVLDRSIMTPTECENEFDIYFSHIHPWTCYLSSTTDRQPLMVRSRSPLLFHTILLVTLYFRPHSTSNNLLYRAVSSVLDSILAPQILCPQPDQLSPDFVKALHLLLLYKPAQWAALSARGITDSSAVEQLSKMNVRSSWMLRGLVSRVSGFIGLPNVTNTFARAFADQHLTPIPEEIINDQRLYFGVIFNEQHGALQSGKPSNFLPHEALKTTRLFATLRRQPHDVRLAASVELAAAATNLLSTRKENDQVNSADLERFDEEVTAWQAYWGPILDTETGDSLAFTSVHIYAAFVRIVINGFAFTRWKMQKKENGRAGNGVDHATGSTGVPKLSKADWESIRKAVVATEHMILSLTMEGKEHRMGGRPNLDWAKKGSPLTLDPTVVQVIRWASDSITCVVFAYSLIALAKLHKEGLLRCNLELIPPATVPIVNPPLMPSDKIARLLEVGAAFLAGVAPTPHHPAVRQSTFLKRIRDAGISGRRPVISAPGSPRPTQHSGNGTHLNGMQSSTGITSTTTMPDRIAHGDGYQSYGTLFNAHNPSAYETSPMHTSLGEEDPYSALLSGVSPDRFDGVDGDQTLFGMDLGGLDGIAVDWDGLEAQLGNEGGVGRSYSEF